MFLNQVEAFVNVVSYKSFSKAAKALYLSQPTISSHIKSLESELSVQLLIRTTKEIVLTDAGRVFYEYALELINIRDISVQKLKEMSKEASGALKLSASTVPAQYVLPQILPRIFTDHPDIYVQVIQKDSFGVNAALENFETELGISGTVIPNSKCIQEELLEDPLVLATPNLKPYQNLDPYLEPNNLYRVFTEVPFICRESGSGTQNIVEQYLTSIGLKRSDLNVPVELPTTESVKQAIYNGLGCSIISKRAVEDYRSFGYVLTYELDSEILNRKLYLMYHKSRMLSALAENFIKYLKQTCAEISLPALPLKN